jgi:large subunit GTPase 1
VLFQNCTAYRQIFILKRRQWADYLDSQGIRHAFFSAANATALQQARRDAVAEAERIERDLGHNEGGNLLPHARTPRAEKEGETGEEEDSDVSEVEEHCSETEGPGAKDSGHRDEEDKVIYIPVEDDTPDDQDPRAKVLSVLELEDLFENASPDLASTASLSCPVSVLRQ